MPIRLGSMAVNPPGINSIYWGSDLVYIAKKLITISGVSPLAFVNALAKPIKSLTQYGKTTQVSTPILSAPVDIVCNNGALKMVDDELPSGYRRLESIRFSGNTYYETQEKLYGTDIVTITIADFVSSGQNLFGCYSGANETNFSMYIYGTSTGQAYWRYGQTLYRPTVGSTAERTITFGAGGTTGFKNDVTYDTVDFETDSTAWIGALPNSSSAKFNGRIDGNILVSNRLKYIPCERETDSAICYYEAVNGVVLEPNGDAPTAGAYDNTHNHIMAVGTPEVLTVSASGAETQTASVANLFAVGDYKDEQDIISGTVTRRCEAVISDGTTPSGRYIGTVGEGNIIVKVRETGYEGDIVTFDADRVAPLNGLSVNVEPIQDLHGYDNPWPAGGGKNKFDSSLFDTPTVGNALVYTHYDVPNGTYTMSTPDFPLVSDIANVFFLTGAVTSGAKSSTNGVTTENSRTITVTDGHYTVVYRSSQSSNTNNPKDFKWQIESGSAPTAWTPFSNICPISGWTAANVTRTGKNLIPSIDDTAFWDTSGFFNKNGTITVRANYKTSTYLPVIGGCQYVFSTFNENETIISGWKGLLVYDSNKQPLQDTFYENNATNIAITVPDEGSYIKIYTVLANNITYQQLELGATSTTYEPYTGNTYTIQLGETVYGGMLDVLTGKMMVTDANIASYAGELLPSTWISDRDVYAEGTTPTTGAQVVYKLAEPFEITLTPTQIDTLLGENNLWTDAGTIKIYVADAELIEYVAPQPLSMANGSNTIEVTSNVGNMELQVEAWVHT